MSGVISAPAVWTTEKTVPLPIPKRHLHRPNPVSNGFVAPKAGPNLFFKPMALAAAIARTATTREGVPADFLIRQGKSVLLAIESLIQDGEIFGLTSEIEYLADSARTHVAGQIGAGISHLYMELLGYRWRANASCLTPNNIPHGDFLYDGGNVRAHGVVLTEAHGSFSSTLTINKIRTECEKKYFRQVRPWVGQNSPYGRVVHGYSVAFGCRPGVPGAIMALSETRVNGGSGIPEAPPVAPNESISTSMALTTHRSNFLLIGATPVVKWIDWLRSSGKVPEDEDPIEFDILRYAGREYMAATYPFMFDDRDLQRLDELYDYMEMRQYVPFSVLLRLIDGRPALGGFVIERTAGERFLTHLSKLINSDYKERAERLELPVFVSEGFGHISEPTGRAIKSADYEYVLFGDGLALLNASRSARIVGRERWLPRQGIS